MLADLFEMPDRFVARPHHALGRQVPRHDLAHLGFDLRKVIRSERLLAREVVIEAILDGRADRYLGAGEKLLHRHGEHMGGVVPDHFQRFGILAGDDADFRVPFDGSEDVPFLAVDGDRERRFGEPWTDGGRDLRAGHPARERQHLAVGQSEVHLGAGRGHRHGILLLLL